ncbi:hypothetical protein [Roseovarius arcticus]|uniref:hypothetical protein n=1 Tax=Roseovarius arcticus TaxID=2547404 RepID=UPI001110B42C|nr:hypothetical protein [Roseovarius arcticus]
MQREYHTSTLLKNIKGSTITLATLEGIEMDDPQRFFGDTADHLQRDLQANPEHTAKQLREAGDRYVFITPANTNAPPEGQEV